jgi:hypothetical protein
LHEPLSGIEAAAAIIGKYSRAMNFGPNVPLAKMREITDKVSEADVRRAAARLPKK